MNSYNAAVYYYHNDKGFPPPFTRNVYGVPTYERPPPKYTASDSIAVIHNNNIATLNDIHNHHMLMPLEV